MLLVRVRGGFGPAAKPDIMMRFRYTTLIAPIES